MQLKDIKKEGIFTTLYYELTWKIGWEQLLSILDVVIRTDFQEKGFQSLAVGMIAGTTPQDVTRDVLANGGDIRRSAFAKGESGYAVLTGYSHLMKVTMRIIVWNRMIIACASTSVGTPASIVATVTASALVR